MILQYEIDLLKCKYDSILRSCQYDEEQLDNFANYVLPSLARRNANMKQKKLHPSALDANYDKYSCGFQSCGGQLFSSKQKYVQHLNAKHRTQLPDGCRFLAPNDKTLYIDELRCEACGKVYSRVDKLESHLKSSLFCSIQVSRSRDAERRNAKTQELAEVQLETVNKHANEQSVEAESGRDEQSVEAESGRDEQSVEAENERDEQSVETENERDEQSVEAESGRDEQSVEAESGRDEQSVEAAIERDEQSVEAAIEQHNKLYEQLGDYEKQEKSGGEKLDLDEFLLVDILNKYEKPRNGMNKSKRKHITPSCSREQIAKKQTTD
jgi:hypothetical protein